jgi:hypothetical protein
VGGISFSTGAGVRTGAFTSRSGNNVCPLGKKGVKPSSDKCKCCSGDQEYTSLSFSFSNLVQPSAIKLL